MRIIQALSKVTGEFCKKTSIHGLKYITVPDTTICERIFWLAMTAVILILVGYLLVVSYMDSYSTPTRESIMSHNYPTWMIPFPAITLCNTNRIFHSKAINFIRTLSVPDGVTEEELLEDTKILLYIMGFNVQINVTAAAFINRKNEISRDRLFHIQQILDLNNKSFDEVMYELGQPCSELIVACVVKGQLADCLQVFQTSKTFYGYCCSFNYLMPSLDVSIFGQEDLRSKTITIMDSFSPESDLGVSVILNPAYNDYFASSDNSGSIKVLVHYSIDYPNELDFKSSFPVGTEVFLTITPSTRYSNRNLPTLSPHKRKCLFDDEVRLKYFSPYSFQNCLVEAKMDYLIKSCRCLPFNYPHIGNHKTCTLKSYRCIKQYFATFDRWSDDNITVNINGQKITCLEECNSYKYDVTTTVGNLEAAQLNSLLSNYAPRNGSDLILAHIYLGDHVSMRTIRQISYAWSNFTATFGGFLGVALGCSVISIVEMFYFFTIRFLQYLCSENKTSPNKIVVKPIRY